MGIFLDTIEDTSERLGQFIDEIHKVERQPSGTMLPSPSPIYAECPICGEFIYSRGELNQHIVLKHADKHVYLRANNKIVRGFAYLKEPPESLEVVLIGIQSARIEIQKSGFPDELLTFSGSVSLIPHINNFDSGEIHLNIEYANDSREFTLVCGKMPDFHHDLIDRHALKLLFLPLSLNQDPNFSEFSQE